MTKQITLKDSCFRNLKSPAFERASKFSKKVWKVQHKIIAGVAATAAEPPLRQDRRKKTKIDKRISTTDTKSPQKSKTTTAAGGWIFRPQLTLRIGPCYSFTSRSLKLLGWDILGHSDSVIKKRLTWIESPKLFFFNKQFKFAIDLSSACPADNFHTNYLHYHNINGPCLWCNM